jgi:hypothetical protein
MALNEHNAGNKHNNNAVYPATTEQLLTDNSTRQPPEMAVQSGAGDRPIATEDVQLSGHMTTEEPIGGEKLNQGQNMRESSHLEN